LLLDRAGKAVPSSTTPPDWRNFLRKMLMTTPYCLSNVIATSTTLHEPQCMHLLRWALRNVSPSAFSGKPRQIIPETKGQRLDNLLTDSKQ
jgi:hypothetical protein